MLKVVTFTDWHVRMKTPIGRVEQNWLEVCLAQLEQVLGLAKQQEASAVLCSGDLGDSPDWSPMAITAVMELLKQYNIPLITTLGQHDVYSHNLDTWEKSVVGVLSLAGLITVLRGGKYVKVDEELMVYGFAYGEDATDELLAGQWVAPSAHKNLCKIGLVHASIGEEDDMGWKGIKHQKVSGLNVAQFGDIHAGFEPYEMPSGCCCFNPGSLTRASRSDRGRIPQCAVIEINGKDWELELYEISDGDDEVCFFEDTIATELGDTASSFKELLKNARDYQDETPRQRIKRVAETVGASDATVKMVLDRLQEER